MYCRGTSEWTAQQLTEVWGVAQRLNLIGPAMEQPQYHLLERTKVLSCFVSQTHLRPECDLTALVDA